MATSTRRLPKVSQYVRNVGKSVAFASIEAVKSNTPGVRDFMSENDDFFKEIYAGIKDFKGTLRKSEKAIKDSNIYKAIDLGIKNTMDDLKSGNLYNTSREKENTESLLGIDDESLGLNFDDDYEVSFDDDDDGHSESSSRPSADAAVFAKTIRMASSSANTVAARGTDLVIKSTRASTKLLSAYMEKSTATLHSGLGAVYSAVDRVYQVMNGPMIAHMENSRKFYDTSINLMQEQNAMMKELLEMQRNLYKAQGSAYNGKNSKLDDILDYDGTVNLKAYGKHIKGNVKEALETFGFMDMGVNLPMILAQAPLKMMIDYLAEEFMPKNLKKSLKGLDKGFTSLFSQFISSANRSGSRVTGNVLVDTIMSVLGVNLKNKTSINTSNYNKGPVPFDGITRKSIVEVIPGYLARIEAALTGNSERFFDTEKGKWRSASEIKTSFEAERLYSIRRANSDLFADSDKLVRNIKNPRAAKEMEAMIRNAAEIIYEDGGYFAPSIMRKKDPNSRHARTTSGNAYKKYGFKTKDQFDAFVSSLSDNTIRGLALENMRARESYSRRMEELEAGSGIYNLLFNNGFDGATTSSSTSGKKIMSKNILTLTHDTRGNSIFDYLRMILDAIGGRGGQRYNNPNSPNRPSSGRKRKRSRNRARSPRTESEGDSGSEDDSHTDAWDEALYQIYQEDKDKHVEYEQKHAFSNWLNNKLEKSAVGRLFVKLTGGVSEILTKPMKYTTAMLEKADNNLFHLMFGENALRDENGDAITSVFQFMIDKVKKSFKDLSDWIKTTLKTKVVDPVWGKIKPYYDKYGRPVIDELKDMGQRAKARVKTGFGNTFGRFFNSASDSANTIMNGGVASADDIENDIGARARGGIITKRGLTMVSPGEMIIPASFNKKEQNRMLALEKRDRSRIANHIALNARGTVNTDQLKATLGKIFNENKGQENYSKIGASGIVGASAGLLFGNPLLGAMAGAGLSILNNSDTLKDIVFGEVIDDKTGERKGGVISKKIQDIFSKALPDMGDYGIAGGILGLLTPFGPLGGAAIGAGIGYLKNSESFKKFIFGDESSGKEGLFGKEAYNKFKDKVKEAAPNMLIGAGLGVLAGPFGLLGNAAFGAGLGLLSTTSEFNTFLFGDEKTGQRGLVESFKEGFINPAKDKLLEFTVDFKQYAEKHILSPMKDFWKPVNQMLINVIKGTSERIGDNISDAFERILGLPMADFMQEKVFRPAAKFVAGALKAPYKIGRFALSVPFRAAGAIGNSIRTSQIRRGTAYNMSASERLAFRDKHYFRFNRFNAYRDKTRQEDEILAGMDESQLSDILAGTRAGLSSYSNIQRASGTARANVSNTVSNFFNNTKDSSGRSLYSRANFNDVNELTKLAQEGNMDEVDSFINSMKGLTDIEKKNLRTTLVDKVEAARLANATMNRAHLDSDALDSQMSKLLGRKFKGKKDRRQLMHAAEAELKARHKVAKIEADANKSNVENINDFSKLYAKTNQSIITHLAQSNEFLHKLIDPNYEANIIGEGTDGVPITNKLISDGSDGIEATEAEQEAAASTQREEKSLIAQQESTSALTTLKEYLVGDKEKVDEKEGFLSKVLGKVTKIGGFLGMAGLSLTGVSLFGHATEWFKTSIWPKIKAGLFGDKNNTEPTMLDKFREMFGGLFKKAGTWVTEKINSISEWFASKGGFKGIFLNDIVPGFINGLSYAINNLVTPVTALLVKAMPTLFSGMVKALIAGIGLTFNRPVNSPSINDGGIIAQVNEYQKAVNNSIDASDKTGVTSNIKNAFSGLMNSIKSTDVNVDFGDIFKDKNSAPSKSLMGLLGQTNRTNEVEIDENGIITTDYVTRNTSDTILSKAAKASGRAFLRGLGGSFKSVKAAKGIGKSIAAGTAKFATPGVLNKFKGVSNYLAAGLKAGKNTINSAGKLGQVANDALAKTADGSILNAKDDAAKGIMKIFKNIAESDGIMKRIVKFASDMTSSAVTEKVVKEAIEKIGKKLSDKLLGSITKSALKSLGNIIAKFSPLTLLTFAVDFAWGFDNAYTILGLAKGTYDLNLAHKCGCGLINVITNYFTLGLISPEFIVDIVMDTIFPVFGIDSTKMQLAREGAQAFLDEWNLTNPNEQYDNLQDFNNKDKWWAKVFKTSGNYKPATYNGAASTYAANYQGTTKASSSTGYNPASSYLTGGSRNHIYQSDRRIANMRYGNSTIGEAGCAPVAATNLLNSLNHSSGLADAASYAERRGMTAQGGTDIGYFNSYLASKGISTTNSSNSATVMNALKNGNQVVMLGMDRNNPNGPFGTTPHFITAKGISRNGNIIVEDPDLPYANIKYKPRDVMNSMMSSVIAKTGRRGGRRNRRIGFARNSAAYSSGTLGPDAIIAIASSQIGVTEEGKTNKTKYCRAFYGTNTGAAWCCIFVWWVFNQAGASKLFGSKEAYCPTLMIRFGAKGRIDMNPKVGDIVFFNFSGGKIAKHVGIIIGINSDGTITTIEGNTGSSNDTNGGQVMQRTRKMSTVVGCAHPEYPYVYDANSVVDMSKYGDNTDYESLAFSGSSGASTSTTGTLLNALTGLGTTMIKSIYGNNAYEALFGMSDTTNNTVSSTNNSGNTGKSIWDYLISKGYTRAGAAGIMGNLYAESGLNPNNIQNTFEKKLGSDDVYTSKINNRSYSKSQFAGDSAGYGLAQWTYKTRKKKLYEATIEKGKSINDLTGQLDYLTNELASDYSRVNNKLKSTSSINDASDIMLLDFEKPAGAEGKKNERRSYSQNMMNQYGSGRNRNLVGGNATRALNAYRVSSNAPTTSKAYAIPAVNGAVDYQTFLQTIITILLTIADNTALLTKILDILSDKLDVKVDKKEITAAAKAGRDTARKRISDMLNTGTNYGRDVNNNYTNYLVAAMEAIASE